MIPNTSLRSVYLYNRIIFVLSIIGIIIAFYVTQSFLRGSPIVCVNAGCELVRKNPASFLWGVPVPAVGLVGYSMLTVFAFLRTLSESNFRKFLIAILAMAAFGVLFVGWFTYTELFIIKGVCTWCAISAVNMVVIFGLAVLSHHQLP
ncbi:MAG: vitamin K epoxide reductase family protein [Patescibacteria group bacterium]